MPSTSASASGEPARQGEVVQGYEPGEARAGERGQDAPVVRDRGAAELAGRGLDPGPLQREPVGVVAQRLQQGEVLGVAMEVVDSVRGGLNRG
jgi:hypothetical protein